MTFPRKNEKLEMVADDSFPAGLRVMVVDDDPICLLILDRMLRRCSYQVTIFERAVDALEALRGHKDDYDLVISDVCMPDMDGFKLLELVGLEMDLPVIMMSANGETTAVMKGIKHGACDYLLKPVRIEELKNIWQHVVRKRWRACQQRSIFNDCKTSKVFNIDSHLDSSEHEDLDGLVKQSRKRKDSKEEEEDVEQELDDSSGTKKSRVVWSVDLHQQFVAAVNHLGIDKAVPKRILELMNVQGLSRENIASHLQKYRLYLKRINGAVHHTGGLHSPFAPSLPGSLSPTYGAANAGRFGGIGDLRTLAATGQLPSQAVRSTLQAGLMGRLDPKISCLGDADSILMQAAALQGINGNDSAKPLYNLATLQSSDVKQLVQSSHAPTFPLTLAGSPSNLAAMQQKQRLETAASLECIGHLVGLGSNVQVEPHNMAPLPTAGQHQSDGCPSDSLIAATRVPQGQHGLINDEEPWTSPSSATNGGNGSFPEIRFARSFRVGHGTSLGARVSLSVPGSCDNADSHTSAPNVPSPFATSRLSSKLNTPGIQSVTGFVNEGSCLSSRDLSPNFVPPAGGLSHNWQEPMMLQRQQVGWQLVEESLALGHPYSSLSSLKLSHGSPRGLSQGLGNGQVQAQLHCSGPNAPCAETHTTAEILTASMGVVPLHLKPMGYSTISNAKEEVLDGSEHLRELPSHGVSDQLLKQPGTLGFADSQGEQQSTNLESRWSTCNYF